MERTNRPTKAIKPSVRAWHQRRGDGNDAVSIVQAAGGLANAFCSSPAAILPDWPLPEAEIFAGRDRRLAEVRERRRQQREAARLQAVA